MAFLSHYFIFNLSMVLHCPSCFEPFVRSALFFFFFYLLLIYAGVLFLQAGYLILRKRAVCFVRTEFCCLLSYHLGLLLPLSAIYAYPVFRIREWLIPGFTNLKHKRQWQLPKINCRPYANASGRRCYIIAACGKSTRQPEGVFTARRTKIADLPSAFSVRDDPTNTAASAMSFHVNVILYMCHPIQPANFLFVFSILTIIPGMIHAFLPDSGLGVIGGLNLPHAHAGQVIGTAAWAGATTNQLTSLVHAPELDGHAFFDSDLVFLGFLSLLGLFVLPIIS